MNDDVVDENRSIKPYLLRLRLALAPYAVHFRCLSDGYIKDETMRMLERDVVKKTLDETRRNSELRWVLDSMQSSGC